MNRSRKMTCPECSGANYWRSNPAPKEELHCRYCHSFVSTYEEFIVHAAHRSAEHLLAQFTEAKSEEDMAYLRNILTTPEQRLSA